jgi:glycosyltransferase involved in cell wall biosynthesis
MFTPKILQVLDPSHESWVQGGVFKDLRNSSKVFRKTPVYLGSPFKTQGVFRWAWSVIRIVFSRRILFSSLTPLENYSKVFFFIGYFQQKTLWFTHNEYALNERQLKAVNRCGAVLVHSSKAKKNLQEFYTGETIVMLAAIEFDRFLIPSKNGDKIVWVGTYSPRKNPDYFLKFVSENLDLNFRIIGKDWPLDVRSKMEIRNLEYLEISGPLSSSDFDNCDIYLCTSSIEGGPMPLLESIAAGLNPITTDVGFTQDVFEYFKISKEYIYKDTNDVRKLIENIRLERSNNIYTDRMKVRNLNFNNLAALISNSYR